MLADVLVALSSIYPVLQMYVWPRCDTSAVWLQLDPSEPRRRYLTRRCSTLAAASLPRGRSCQKRGVAYPRLPYLRRGETMLFDVRVQLVIRPEVTTNG